jgi:hypothetical protein
MRFFKCGVYIIFTMTVLNLAFNLYMYRELREPNIIIPSDPRVAELQIQSMTRDTQILQSVLMVHHDRQMHKLGDQILCPLCDEHNNLKTIIVKQEN